MKPKLSAVCAVFVLTCSLPLAARAAEEAARPELPNFDQRREPPAAPRAAEEAIRAGKSEAIGRLAADIADVRVEFDAVLGSPKRIASPSRFLSGAGGKGGSISEAAADAFAGDDPHRAAKAFLHQHRALFGHGAEALNQSRIKRDFVTPHSGLRTVVWEQQLDGLPIFEGVLIAHTTKRGELVNLSSLFVADPAGAAEAGTPNRAAALAAPAISAPQAVALAAQNMGEKTNAEEVAPLEAVVADTNGWQRFKATGLKGETQARRIWLPMNPRSMRLCWEVILTSRTRGEMFRVLIDAATGEAQVRHGLTEYASPATYRVYTSDSPSPFSPGHFVPSTNQPPLTARTLVTWSALSTNASPAGWISDGENETRGNNVDAHLDLDDDNQPDLPRPQGSPLRVFDFPIDFTQAPGTYDSASVVQLFYYCNWIHDRLYDLGFTEAAGNFQVNNFGRGGQGNDPVQADGQDGGGTDNANFSTPPDGSSGRMQMYLWTGPNPDRDGDFEGEVVLHEYTHGLSNRRVGGGVGLSALQSRGMGEGWSDWYGIALLAEAGDDLGGNIARGAYSRFQVGGTFRENYYYGGRRYPYSTNLLKNPLTFKDIDPAQADPHAGVPRSPVVGNEADQVHNQGNVWCVTLWEARANLVAKHGFAVGNELILRLVTDGLNLSPPNPNFLEARDAILQAEQVLTGGSNQLDLWRAFAKRGMGAFATSPDSSTTEGVVEDYSLPDDLTIAPSGVWLVGGPPGGPFAPTTRVFTLSNSGTNPLPWTAGGGPLVSVSPANGTLPVGGPAAGVTATLNPVVASLPFGVYRDTVFFSNEVSGAVQRRQLTVQVGGGGSDHYTEIFTSGDNDLDNSTLTFTPDGSADFYGLCRTTASSFPTDPASGTMLTLSDDSFATVTLSSGASIALYGVNSSVLYVGANGYITFVQGDTDFTESTTEHFSRRRVSALFDDLDPEAGGTVSWKQLADRVAVTWQNVPEFATANANSFQIELFFNGTIRITYLGVAATDGLAGLSRGAGLPIGFVESNLSGYGACLPSLTLLVPGSANEGAGLLVNAGEVRIRQTRASNLTINLSSTDSTEATVPSSVIIVAGQTNVTFDVAIQNDAVLDGSRIAGLAATATGFRSSQASITVHDDETATLSLVLPASAQEGNGLLTNGGELSVNPPPDESIVVYLSVSDTNELTVPVPALAIIPAGRTSAVFNVLVIDDQRIDGPQTGCVTAHVENWTDGAACMTILDNEIPGLTVTLPSQINEFAGTITNAGTVRLSGTLFTNLVVALDSSDTSELAVPATITILSNTLLRQFNLTAVDDFDTDGNQVVIVTASAPGFPDGVTSLTVVDNEIPIAPYNPRPPHQSSNNPVTVDLVWLAGEGNQIINGDFETGDFDGWTRENTGLGDFVINAGAFDPDSPDGPLPAYGGSFSALSQQSSPGRHAIYQEVRIPSAATSAGLGWAHRVRNHAAGFAANQQFRIEVRSTNNVLLAMPFAIDAGSLLGDWEESSISLLNYRDQTIRVAFVDEDALGYLNVHLDNVRLDVGAPMPSTFDVYFGTSTNLGPEQLLGNTTNTSWNLPPLAFNGTYYWRVVAWRGTVSVSSPVWQFRTPITASPATLVRTGAAWKYLDDGSDQGAAWRGRNFDDSEWVSGAAQLGYGDADEATVVRGARLDGARIITTYFRHAFGVSNASDVLNLNLRLLRDDGGVVYLNSNEVFRSNMPAGAINYLTLASSTINAPTESAFFPTTVSPGLLINGTNVLAVEIHQVLTTSSDISFDLDLTGSIIGGSNLPPTVVLTNPPNYASYSTPTNFVLSAAASDPDGTISRVEFFIDGARLGEDLTSPYSISWFNPPAGNHVLAAVASDNRGGNAPSAAVNVIVTRRDGFPLPLVAAGSVWRYLDEGTDEGIVWRGTNFNDGNWPSGPAQLGYGDDDETTLVSFGPDPDNKYITTYFRHSFTNDAVLSSLTLNLLRDDGAVVYLNGNEMLRDNMPTGVINHQTPAAATVNDPAEDTFFSFAVSPLLSIRGRNVLAAEIHQRDALSSDISFDLALTGVGNYPPSVALTTPAPGAVYPYPQPILLNAAASDRYGAIRKIEFFQGTTKLGEDTTDPYSLMWSNVPAGQHTLMALATDNHSGTNRSAAVQITVNLPPTLVARRSGNQLELSWPALPAGFSLESTTNLNPAIVWNPVTNEVLQADGSLSVLIDASTGAQFFRLIKP